MDASASEGYHPPPGFVEDTRDPLIDLNLTDSKELWLVQWPINQPPPYIDGQQISLNLNSDGQMGTFEDASGKSYDLISSRLQGSQPIVLLPSAAGAKIAGKISKRVSLVHYPEPSELKQRSTFSSQYQAATSTMSGHRFITPTRTIKPNSSQAMGGYSTPSSRNKSSLSESRELPRSQKGRKPIVASGSINNSTNDLGKGISNVTSTSSFEHFEEKKPKKKKKKVES